MGHSFDQVASSNYAEKTSITGVTANAVSVDLSMGIPTYPASAKFLDPWGIRKSNGSLGFEANSSGTFYLNYEQNSPDTVVTYTEDIIWSDGRTSTQRIIGIFGANSQKVWIRSGGTSTLILNLTKALAFTATRMIFGSDSAFLSDMGGTARYDKIFVDNTVQTQAAMEAQSDSRTLVASHCYFFNDCTGATSFVTDGSGNSNTFTQTGATSDFGSDTWPVASAVLRPPEYQASIFWWDVPVAVARGPPVAAIAASAPAAPATILRRPQQQTIAQSWWDDQPVSAQRRTSIAGAIAAPDTVLAGCRAATAALALWSIWGTWDVQPQRTAPIAAVAASTSASVDTILRPRIQPTPWDEPAPLRQRQTQVAAISATAVTADTILSPRDFTALSWWWPGDGDQAPPKRRPLVPASNPPAADAVPRAPGQRSLWVDPGLDPAIKRPIAAISAVPSRFPLSISADLRYLVDVNGTPFPILGRASWNVLQETASKIADYLDDCVAKGFTAVEMRLASSDGTTTGATRATRAPFANNGTLLPFTKKLNGAAWNGDMPPTAFSSYPNINNDAPDFTTPDLSPGGYWDFVDAFMNAALNRGLLVLAFPSYVGFKGTNQGWMAEMVANGATRMQTYGAFVASRYKGWPNIVWMIGGDSGTGTDTFTAPQIAVEQALVDGMQSVTGQLSTKVAAEWNSPAIFDDQTDITVAAGYQTLNSAYMFTGDIATQARRGYNAGTKPAFALEYPYDQEGSDGTNVNTAATQPVRRFTNWGWLSGIGGYVTGNGFVWPFDHTGGSDDWENHLSTTGAQDLQRLNTLIQSIEWWRLVPSGLGGMRSLIPTGGGSSSSSTDYIAAACAANGTLLLAYVPPASGGTFTVDLRSMRPTIRARWWNPTTGTFATNGSAAGTFSLSNTASAQSFTTPGNNGTGDTDWFLLLDTQEQQPTPVRQRAALAWWDAEATAAPWPRWRPAGVPASPVAGGVTRGILSQTQALWSPQATEVPQRGFPVAAISAASVDTVLRPVQQQAALAFTWADFSFGPQPRRNLILDAPADTVPRAPNQDAALALWVDGQMPGPRPFPVAAITAPPADSFPRPLRQPTQWPEPESRPARMPGLAAILAPVAADTVLRPAQAAELPWDEAQAPSRRTSIAAVTAPAPATPDTVISGRTGAAAALAWWQPDPVPTPPRRNLVVNNPPTADVVPRAPSQWIAIQALWADQQMPGPRALAVAAITAAAAPDTVLRPLSQAAALALWSEPASLLAPRRTLTPDSVDTVLVVRTASAINSWWTAETLSVQQRRVLVPASPPAADLPRSVYQGAALALWVEPDAPVSRRAFIAATTPSLDSVPRRPARPPEWLVPDLAPVVAKPTAAITAPPPPPPDSVFRGLGRANAVLALWWTDPDVPRASAGRILIGNVAIIQLIAGPGQSANSERPATNNRPTKARR